LVMNSICFASVFPDIVPTIFIFFHSSHSIFVFLLIKELLYRWYQVSLQFTPKKSLMIINAVKEIYW
jgi:hypothetical protein